MSDEASNLAEGVAIIGMALRVPGATSPESFWRNLRGGVESRTELSDAELEAAGVDAALRSRREFVRAAFILEGAELFDAGFFGFSPREAELMDPQQRVFLECAWEALERAGYEPSRYPGAISVYAGSGSASYMVSNLLLRPDVLRSVGSHAMWLGNERDFLPTRVSHRLDLKGPSVGVQTACSTSLVAVHLACQSLLTGESDMALAGGVSITFPQKTGYQYVEGGIASADGHCRAFDAQASGSVGSSGAGVVVLKRLADALADGDTIHAVIRGSAINNDGSAKVGYTAPGVDGQVAVISEALEVAGVEPASLQYVEAHGTGTVLGDPIEVTALNQVFSGLEPGRCALGSVKTNIGHLDAAAGVAGLIKTTLALSHREIPPSLNFQRANPRLELERGPFFVASTLREWPTGQEPRRAGVSSFGIGGTNAHVVLEEAPPVQPSASALPWQVLVLSARSAAALEEATANLATHLSQRPEVSLADMAYTLQVGRKRFSHRRVLVCRDVAEVREALEKRDAQRLVSQVVEASERPVVFLFPGQGSQHVDMGRGLYETDAVFRKHVDACCEKLVPHLGLDLREVLFPPPSKADQATLALTRTELAQPALFMIEYALARRWMVLGVKPEAMLGHSLGEYVAACLAGVFSLEDALALVAARGRIMQQAPAGSMLSVHLSEAELRPLLGAELSVAAINAPQLSVVSGPTPAIEALEGRLRERGVECRPLHTSHAFHSAMMDPLLGAFAERVRSVRLSPPKLPYMSNLTGTWVTAAQATDLRYWVDHLRQGVRFSEGLQGLLSEPERIFLEVGPGNALCSLVRQVAGAAAGRIAITSMRHVKETQSDRACFLGALGKLWIAGVPVDWAKLHGAGRRRIPLPTYPFQRERYWVEPAPVAERESPVAGVARRRADAADWVYAPVWRQLPPAVASESGSRADARWLIFLDSAGLGRRLVERLEAGGAQVATVIVGEGFSRQGARAFSLDPARSEHYHTLLSELGAQGWQPQRVLHLWGVGPEGAERAEVLEAELGRGFYSLLFLARALEARVPEGPLRMEVVTSGLHEVTGGEPLHPARAMVLGVCRVLGQENLRLRCRSLDVVLQEVGTPRALEALWAELGSEAREPVVALRGGRAWAESFESVRLPEPQGLARLREGGVYLITGGLGRMGLALAEHLARVARARLVLAGRTELPPRPEWESWLAAHGEARPESKTLRRLLALEAQGAEVLVLRADVSRAEDVERLVARAVERFGTIHGVIHAAGLVGTQALVSVQEAEREHCEPLFAAKVHGVRALARALRGREMDWVVLASSLGTVLGGLGFSAYAAANLYLDAFAIEQARSGTTPWISIDWDGWSEDEALASEGDLALRPSEGVRLFQRLLAAPVAARWVVSTGDLAARRRTWVLPAPASGADAQERTANAEHARPHLATEFVAPRDSLEQDVAKLWQELLGVAQVGIHDNFFELGGHSLLATRVMSRVREIFQVELSPTTLFEAPTVAELATTILATRAESVDAAELEALLDEIE